jgi:hypothetical protein
VSWFRVRFTLFGVRLAGATCALIGLFWRWTTCPVHIERRPRGSSLRHLRGKRLRYRSKNTATAGDFADSFTARGRIPPSSNDVLLVAEAKRSSLSPRKANPSLRHGPGHASKLRESPIQKFGERLKKPETGFHCSEPVRRNLLNRGTALLSRSLAVADGNQQEDNDEANSFGALRDCGGECGLGQCGKRARCPRRSRRDGYEPRSRSPRPRRQLPACDHASQRPQWQCDSTSTHL